MRATRVPDRGQSLESEEAARNHLRVRHDLQLAFALVALERARSADRSAHFLRQRVVREHVERDVLSTSSNSSSSTAPPVSLTSSAFLRQPVPLELELRLEEHAAQRERAVELDAVVQRLPLRSLLLARLAADRGSRPPRAA
jgi:hypothetical protein